MPVPDLPHKLHLDNLVESHAIIVLASCRMWSLHVNLQWIIQSVGWRDLVIIVVTALLPGLPYRPLVGNMLDALSGEAMSTAIRWIKQCKSLTIRYYYFGGKERILTADPKLMGKALFFLSGDVHHSMRKLLNPAFSINVLQNMLPVFEDKAHSMVSLWLEECRQAGNQPVQINVQDFMTRITLDTVCITGLDYNIHAIGSGDTAGVKIFTRYLRQVGGRTISSSFIPFYYHLPFAANRQRWEDEKYIISLIKERIQAKRQQYWDGCENTAAVKDFLSLLVLARDEDGQSLPDNLVFQNVTGIMFAGFDTTSVTLTWALLLLASYPDIQTRAREEVLEVCADPTQPLTHETLDKLGYLNCVLKETQRLYPVVSNTTRRALEEDNIDGMEIPAGTNIVLHLGALHRSEENWPDAEKFEPERFMSTTVEPYHHLPFITGPYMCIGSKYALLEMKTVLASILREFRLQLVPGYTFRRIQALSVKPHPPLMLAVTKLSHV
ncbi:CP4V2-like protein [Mya arenaria]|uniref:CP4V2-like protein n=1 Tax=Mya arenaria TaxID=6604 RepID=A0ABY7DY26_MYAAR|nr:CP4V2-like protein [Mya arenaria]